MAVLFLNEAYFQLMFNYTHLIEPIARNIYRHFFDTFSTKTKKICPGDSPGQTIKSLSDLFCGSF